MSSKEGLDFIDVRKLIGELGIEGACRTAETYFAGLEKSVLAKPFDSVVEAPRILSCFAKLLEGMALVPGMTVVDFGAGSCWASRLLTQLGLKVISLDVSPSALEAGKALYSAHPVFGSQPHPTFLLFDGREIALESESVDRIISFDAFHHVPNQEQVIREMCRVLKRGGIAGFSEPGPDHSASPEAQMEMRMYGVVENGIVLRDLWAIAQAAGFSDIKVGIFHPFSHCLPLDEFEAYLQGKRVPHEFLQQTFTEMINRRLFFLHKGEDTGPKDSRQAEGLLAEIEVEMQSAASVPEGTPVQGRIQVRNTGNAIWLPTTGLQGGAPRESLFDSERRLLRERLHKGAVHLGVHLFDAAGNLLERDYFRFVLREDGKPVHPGQTIEFQFSLPPPPPGRYVFEFDLVSEWICWFEAVGSRTVKVNADIR